MAFFIFDFSLSISHRCDSSAKGEPPTAARKTSLWLNRYGSFDLSARAFSVEQSGTSSYPKGRIHRISRPVSDCSDDRLYILPRRSGSILEVALIVAR